MHRFFMHRARPTCLALAFAALVSLPAATTQAQDPTFVGVISLAVEKDVADKIGLSDEVRAQLQDLVMEREDAALELAQEIKDLPLEERNARLAPFVKESEEKGLALLTDEQKEKLEQVRIARAGLQTLAEESVAKSVGLSEAKRKEVEALVKERDEQLATAEASKRSIITKVYEQKLAKLLTPEQKGAWDDLAGVIEGEASPAPQTAGTPMPMSGRGDTAPRTPGADRTTPMNGQGGETRIVRPTTRPSPDGKLRFQFRHTPWKDVLEWFAGQADMSLQYKTLPQGTLNYADSRAYTPAEAIDLINGVLLGEGYTLIRRQRMLMVINLDDGIPPGLIPTVSESDLTDVGEFEVVGCLFQLEKFTPEEAEADIRKMLGPQGSIVVMPKAKQIYVTETGGKLRQIRRIIERVENPDSTGDEKLAKIEVVHAEVEEALITIRQLMGMPENQNQLPDGSLRMAVDSFAGQLIVNGKPEKIERLREIVKLIDTPAIPDDGPIRPIETPQLVIHPTSGAEPTSVLKVVGTILADTPDIRLELDPKTNNLIAYGPPSAHATIRAVIAQMQGARSGVEVIQLRRVDPQIAVLAINKLFNVGEGGDPNAPKVDADPISRQLLVRGTPDQVRDIRDLLDKMGEGDALADNEDRGNTRFIPLAGSSAQSTLEQLQAIWPSVRVNRIKVVTPSSGSGSRPREMRIHPSDERESFPAEEFYRRFPNLRLPEDAPKTAPPDDEEKPAPISKPGDSKTTERRVMRVPVRLAAYQPPADDAPAQPQSNSADAANEKPESSKKPSKPGAEIVVTVGPNGIVIASEDKEALDQFEELFLALSDRATPAGHDFTVFYLKYARAEVAASLLQESIGAAGGSGDSGGGGSLLGDLAGAALGDAGGGLLGGLLGLGGGGDSGGSSAAPIATSGKVTVIPDPRLNALIVQAAPVDLDLIEQLLKVIDQEFSPETVQTAPPPRLIHVEYVSAEEVAEVVRSSFADRMASAPGQQRQPTPEDFINALRGGGRGGRGGRGGGGGGGNSRDRGEAPKMTVAVDKRSNSLVVSAPDPLFRQVEAFVREIDHAGTETDEVTQVLSLKNANPEMVQRAVSSVVGANAKVNTTTSGNNSPQATSGMSQSNRRGGSRGGGGGQADAQRLQAELIQGLMRGGGGGGGGSSRGGFGGGGGGSRGGGGGSSRGGRGGR